MSIHSRNDFEPNVATLLLSLLSDEETNVVLMEKEVVRCEANVQRHRETIERLEQALRALGHG